MKLERENEEAIATPRYSASLLLELWLLGKTEATVTASLLIKQGRMR